ncbi:MAG: hypothetical protein HQM00_10770 [Magnetococcales bacterium]|nr:hypothetical protein [Magnetococcales bacterium]
MLKSYEAIYDHGQFRWKGTPPDVDRARVIVTILPPQESDDSGTQKRRQPPEILKGSTRILGDIVSSPYSEEEWEAMFERTARQLEGDPEAFK